MLLALTATTVLVASWSLASMPKEHRDSQLAMSEYLLFLTVTVFGAALLLSFRESLYAFAQRLKPWWLDATGAALLLSLAPLGMWHFGGFDHSSIVLSGWYTRSGIVPYRDVPYTLPPLFLMGAEWAFRLFGFRWWAIIAFNLAFALATYFWLVALLGKAGVPRRMTGLLACLCEVATVMVGAYWWYNPATSIAVILVFANALACMRAPRSRWLWVSAAGCLALLLLAKPNAWPAAACAGVLLLSRDAGTRWRAIAVLVGGALLAALLCRLDGFSPKDVLGWYAKIAGSRGWPEIQRDASWDNPTLAATACLVLILLALLASQARHWKLHWRQYLCCAAVAVTSLWMAFTNYELKTSDLMPLALVIVILALRPWGGAIAQPARAIAVLVMLGFAISSGYWAMTRSRVRGIGEGKFFQLPVTEAIHDGFFDGLHTGPRLPRVLREVEDSLRDHPGTVFFGPRMEFAYVAFNRPAPRGLPLFWHPGSAYAFEDIPGIIRAFNADHFQTVIFLRDDYTRMPGALVAQIRRKYTKIDSYSDLTVFVVKAVQPPNAFEANDSLTPPRQ